MIEKVWLLKTAGLIYFFVRLKNQQGEKPKISQIANALNFSRRTVWGYVCNRRPLIQGGYLAFEKRGKAHYFFVIRDPSNILLNVSNNTNDSAGSLFFTSHGLTLAYIERNPGSTVKEISQKRFLTRRTVWGIIGDLRRAELIGVRREGKGRGRGRKEHHYFFDFDSGDKNLTAVLEEEAQSLILEIVNH